MTCKINADTTNGLKLESDTSGEIDIQSNGTTSINFSPSQITITDADSNQPRLLLKNTNADSTPPFLDFQKDSSSPADNDVIGKMRFIGDDDGGNTVAYATIVSTSPDVSDGSENGDLRFETTVDGTNAERMRIDSSGNVGIGTSSPSGKLTVSDIGEDNALYVLGGIKQDDGPGNPWYLGKGILGSTGSEFLIGNGSNELLRIDQSGNVGIGTTSPTGRFTVKQTGFGATNTLFDSSHGTTPQGIVIDFSSASPDNNSQAFLTCRDSTTNRLVIHSDGDIDNHDNSYSGFSDVRLKEQITDSGSQWEDIKNLRVRKFKFKQDVSEKGDSDDLLRLGVIAQELESSGMSGLVSTKPEILWTDEDELPVDEDGNPTVSVGDVKSEEIKSVKYSILYMKSVKALQEAMDRIETLEAKVTALENN